MGRASPLVTRGEDPYRAYSKVYPDMFFCSIMS